MCFKSPGEICESFEGEIGEDIGEMDQKSLPVPVQRGSGGGRAEVETRISLCSFILQRLSMKFFKYSLLSREDSLFIAMRKHLEVDWCL